MREDHPKYRAICRSALWAWLLGAICAGCSQTADESPNLRLQLKDKDPNVRYGAVSQLASVPVTQDSVDDLRAALKDKDPAVRMAASYALGKLGAAAAPALPQLVIALKDPDKRVRSAAAYAVPALGPSSSGAVPALIAATRDSDPEVRTTAAQSLKKIRLAEKYRRELGHTASTPSQP